MQRVSGGCLEDIWKMSEECMQGIMMVSRQYKDGVQMVNRGCLEADLQFQLEDRASQDRPPQDRSSQERSSQDRSSQDRSSQDRSSQDRAIKKGQVRTGQLRRGQVKTGQVSTGNVRLCDFRTGPLAHVKSSYNGSSQIGKGEVEQVKFFGHKTFFGSKAIQIQLFMAQKSFGHKIWLYPNKFLTEDCF